MSELLLKFFKGKRGDIISRLPSGKIVLVNRDCKKRPCPGEEWLCRVLEKERFAVATPIEKIVRVPLIYRIKRVCGHVEFRETSETVEVKESETQDGVYYEDFESSEICEQCKKNCEHKDTVILVSAWNYGFVVRRVCRKCEKTLKEWDLTTRKLDEQGLLNLTEKDFEEIRKLIESIDDNEAREKALEALDRKMNYVREYEEMTRRERELEEKMSEISKKIKELIPGAKEIRIEAENKVTAWFGDYIEVVTGTIGINRFGQKVYETSKVKYFKPIEITPEIKELLREYFVLYRELRDVRNWLIENRPVE